MTLQTKIEESLEKFDKLIDTLPKRVSETPKEVVKSFLKQSQLELLEEVVKEITNWADKNMADGDYNYEKLLIFINLLKVKE